ncbi:hypothetical protein [Luteimicrobium subarcticum]|uniref:ABC transporter family protein n=1 Tax=Luteimicrobium subarcticum TaxID=620910 RepID=A0A2M8WRV5_9MICO|nr:hypothetical protein [Luteimicrobium subarcticum]PJI93659.1 hypothetical protein CLV34_1133 [Luteimicrobium subarcticum]
MLVSSGITHRYRRLHGPRGAGRDALAGAHRPTAGAVTLDGVPVRDPRSRRRVSWMPQDVTAIRGLTVLEQVAYAGWCAGLGTAAGLDPAQRANFRAILADTRRDTTLVVSTHQTDDLADLFDHVTVLAAGRVAFEGTRHAFHALAAGDEPGRPAGSQPGEGDRASARDEHAFTLLVGDGA